MTLNNDTLNSLHSVVTTPCITEVFGNLHYTYTNIGVKLLHLLEQNELLNSQLYPLDENKGYKFKLDVTPMDGHISLMCIRLSEIQMGIFDKGYIELGIDRFGTLRTFDVEYANLEVFNEFVKIAIIAVNSCQIVGEEVDSELPSLDIIYKLKDVIIQKLPEYVLFETPDNVKDFFVQFDYGSIFIHGCKISTLHQFVDYVKSTLKLSKYESITIHIVECVTFDENGDTSIVVELNVNQVKHRFSILIPSVTAVTNHN